VRYMMLIKVDEAASPDSPSEELMSEMGKLLEEMTKAGAMLDTGGLQSRDASTEVRLSGGKLTVVDGPFAEAKEVVGGYFIFQAKTKEEAVEWASRFLAIHGDAWTITGEIRQVMEPE
jgi:hypothetical protein